MTHSVRFGANMRGSGIGARVRRRGQEITVRVNDARKFPSGQIPEAHLDGILAMRKGDRSALVAQLQEHAQGLLSYLNFTSTVFYPNHLMPALVAKASSPEDLEQWHDVASAKIQGIKSRAQRSIYSTFKWGAWSNIIDEATTPDQLGTLIDAWCKDNGIRV